MSHTLYDYIIALSVYAQCNNMLSSYSLQCHVHNLRAQAFLISKKAAQTILLLIKLRHELAYLLSKAHLKPQAYVRCDCVRVR